MSPDQRSTKRKLKDEQIAAEASLPPPSLSEDPKPMPVEEHLRRLRRPQAVFGVVENGLIRPIDPDLQLPERASVIIIAACATGK